VVYLPRAPGEAQLIERLLGIDLLTTTPLEALSSLHRLQTEARRLAVGASPAGLPTGEVDRA
jgi:hypothetical protein